MQSKVASVSPVVLALFFIACGGATQSDLFGGGGAGSQDGGEPMDTGASGADSGNGGIDATTGNDAGRRRDAGEPPVDAGGPPDTGVVVDAGTGDPGIYCGKESQGDVYCAVGQDDCCITGQGTSSIAYKCEAIGALSCLGVATMCDDTADCTGNKVCCGTFDSVAGRYHEVACRSSCSGQGPNGTTLRRFCDPFLQPSDCPQNQACQASQVLTGYYVCL